MKYISKNKWKIALLLIFTSSLFCNLWFIQIHPFLHDWDEKYHSLVAKHLSENFLLPLLFNNPPTAVCDFSWVCNTVWLHKQPLFLWQMATSIKIFGINEFAVRIPSAILLSLLVFPLYRIGTILFDKPTGLIAALLTVSNWFILEHINGLIGMDHNDIAFMFYVTLSIWALVEYTDMQSKRYVLLVGLFAGSAMLCKWVTGLLVFEGFFIYFLFERKKTIFYDLLISTAIALVVFIPWQVYCYINFQEIALHEWKYNSLHFWEVVEGHAHEIDYYFNELKYQFAFLQLLFMVGAGMALFKISKLKIVLPLLLMAVSIYLFFTIAATKIASYTMVIMPLLFIFSAYAITGLMSFFTRLWAKAPLLYILLLPLLIGQNLQIDKLSTHIKLGGDEWFQKRNYAQNKNTQIYKKIASLNLPAKTVIMGFSNGDEIESMFYNGYIGYGLHTQKNLIDTILIKGYSIAIFKNLRPPNLSSSTKVIVLPFEYE